MATNVICAMCHLKNRQLIKDNLKVILKQISFHQISSNLSKGTVPENPKESDESALLQFSEVQQYWSFF